MPIWGIPVGEGAYRTRIPRPFDELRVSMTRLRSEPMALDMLELYHWMVTLTKFAYFFKKGSVWAALGLAIIALLLIIAAFGKNIRTLVFEPKALPASVAFGKLPKIDFSEGVKPQGRITYKLETISGDLPKLPGTAKVFAIRSEGLSFGRIEDIKRRAQQLGFNNQPNITPGGFLSFVDPNDNKRFLSMYDTNGSISYVIILNNQEMAAVQKPKNSQDALRLASDFLSKLNLNRNEFPNSKDVNSQADANLVRVNFYRADLDKLPVLPMLQDPAKGKVWVLIGNDKVLAAKMEIYNLERFTFATYPLKGVAKAYEELQNGQGVFNTSPDLDTMEITSVGLGYVESSKTDGFLEPVYIFGTLGNLKAFVSAVDDSWISK